MEFKKCQAHVRNGIYTKQMVVSSKQNIHMFSRRNKYEAK